MKKYIALILIVAAGILALRVYLQRRPTEAPAPAPREKIDYSRVAAMIRANRSQEASPLAEKMEEFGIRYRELESRLIARLEEMDAEREETDDKATIDAMTGNMQAFRADIEALQETMELYQEEVAALLDQGLEPSDPPPVDIEVPPYSSGESDTESAEQMAQFFASAACLAIVGSGGPPQLCGLLNKFLGMTTSSEDKELLAATAHQWATGEQVSTADLQQVGEIVEQIGGKPTLAEIFGELRQFGPELDVGLDSAERTIFTSPVQPGIMEKILAEARGQASCAKLRELLPEGVFPNERLRTDVLGHLQVEGLDNAFLCLTEMPALRGPATGRRDTGPTIPLPAKRGAQS